MEHPLRVGLDAWPATTHAPGVGRYARELVRALARLPEAPELRLLDVGPGARGLDLGPLPPSWRRVQAELPRAALRALAGLGLGAERLLGGCQLFHRVLPGEPPLGGLPRVQALSELPPRGSPAERALARGLAGPCDVVVFSAAARAEVLARFALAPERVHALPVGCDHWLRDATPLEAAPGPPLVLALGRSDTARGALPLLAALERLRARGVEARLVWCGRPGDAAPRLHAALASSAARSHVRLDERPREGQLAALVARAAVLVHLSVEEWTAVTPLEAALMGAAVVASPLPAFVEALGDAACWQPGDPAGLDADALATSLERALSIAADPAGRRRRRALAGTFTWSRHAALTVALWQRILAR